MIPQPIIDRWAHESGVFSALPDAPVEPDDPRRARWRRLWLRRRQA